MSNWHDLAGRVMSARAITQWGGRLSRVPLPVMAGATRSAPSRKGVQEITSPRRSMTRSGCGCPREGTEATTTARTSEYVLDEQPLEGYSHVLLFRHGRTIDAPNLRERERGLSVQGATDVQQVVRRLAEHLSLHKHELVVIAVRHGNYRQVVGTVGLLQRGMWIEGVWPNPGDVRPSTSLNPDIFWEKRGAPSDVARLARGRRSSPKVGRALLLVGHEPQLGTIAGELLRWGHPSLQWGSHKSALGHQCLRWRLPRLRWGHPRPHLTPSAGVSCIELGAAPLRRPRVLWVIEPTDKTTAEQLRQKIASKMDVAKVFGGVVTLAVGIVLNLLADSKRVATLPHPLAAYLAAAALATALVLYVSTLYAYDSLLMPTRFWATAVAKHQRRSSVVERPPSSANLVLQQNMINIWNRQFTIANLLVIAGFGLLAWGILKIAPWWVLGAVAMACVVAFFGRQINLGTQD
jgi:phosphohistidine phosphatase SixA